MLGSSHNITWTFTNAGNVKVDIILRNSSGKVGPIKTQVQLSAGIWPWTIDKLEDGKVIAPGTDYIVRIRDAGNTFSDDSNNPFSILAAGPEPTLKLLSPNGEESWASGQIKNITWSANWTGIVQLSLFQSGAYKGVIAPSLPSTPRSRDSLGGENTGERSPRGENI